MCSVVTFNLMTHTFRSNSFSTPGVQWTPAFIAYLNTRNTWFKWCLIKHIKFIMWTVTENNIWVLTEAVYCVFWPFFIMTLMHAKQKHKPFRRRLLQQYYPFTVSCLFVIISEFPFYCYHWYNSTRMDGYKVFLQKLFSCRINDTTYTINDTTLQCTL